MPFRLAASDDAWRFRFLLGRGEGSVARDEIRAQVAAERRAVMEAMMFGNIAEDLTVTIRLHAQLIPIEFFF